MGYLDGSSITVDAILTKHGRRLLAEGQGLGISKFALSDDGIDYDLWNIDHPSGSANYGNAITSLPQLEPTPDDFTVMTYKLTTLDRNTKYLPWINLPISTTVTMEGQGMEYSTPIKPVTANHPTETFDFYFTDISGISVVGGTFIDVGGNLGNTPSTADMPQGGLFRGSEIEVSALPTSKKITTTCKITGHSSGAYKEVFFTILPNILQQPTGDGA